MGYLVYIDSNPVEALISALSLSSDSEKLAVYAHEVANNAIKIGSKHGLLLSVPRYGGRNVA